MSFNVTHMGDKTHGLMTIEIFGVEDIQLFKDMVNRAANTWDRAPGHMKHFMDIVTEGKALQKYEDLGSEVKQT